MGLSRRACSTQTREIMENKEKLLAERRRLDSELHKLTKRADILISKLEAIRKALENED